MFDSTSELFPPAHAPIGVDHAKNVNRIVERPGAERPDARPAPDAFGDKLRTLKASDFVLERISTAAQVSAIEAQWQELADHAVESNPFYEPWMVIPALEHLERERRIDFALLWTPHPSGRKGERLLCAVFPLVESQTGPFGGVTVLSMWKHAFCYLGAPLIRTEVAEAAVCAFFDSIARGDFGRAIFRFDDLPGDGLLRHLFVHELWTRRWPNFLGDASTRAYFRPSRDAETYLHDAVPGKRRKELRRLQARLGETVGTVRFTELRDPLEAGRWGEAFARLEAMGWKGEEGVSVQSREAHATFFQKMIRQAAMRDRLMMLALEAGPNILAMKLNLISPGGGSFAFKITYDEAHAKYSPGVLLEVENIARLHQRTDVKWMDSCASPNRFMINQLWPGRREFQSLLFSKELALESLVMALIPLKRWVQKLRG